MSQVNKSSTQTKEPEASPSCKNGCGFFGSPQNQGYCSVCYAQFIKSQTEEKKHITPAPEVTSVHQDAPSQVQQTPAKDEQKDKTRCWSCNKKVGLVGIPCRCTYIFCPKHRQAEAHSCCFDYKASGRDKLVKANPVIVAEKIQKV